VEKDARKIVVECKSFLGRSVIQDFKSALGQYRMYLQILAQTNPDYDLYLAIGEDTYNNDFQRKVIRFIIEVDKIPLIIVDLDKQELIEWIN
jgi:hypothetical protein